MPAQAFKKASGAARDAGAGRIIFGCDFCRLQLPKAGEHS
jgi:hypothetical protein